MSDAKENRKNFRHSPDPDSGSSARLAAIIDEAPQGYIKQPLQTITELASSLDLDFEDDFDGGVLPEAPPPPPPVAPQSRKTGLDAWEEESGFSRNNAEAPTWEEFTSAFFRGGSALSAKPEFIDVDAIPVVPEQADAPAEIDAPAADEQSEFDVLSSLAPAEEEAPAAPPPAPSPSDTVVDLFSDLDVDAAWRQKLGDQASAPARSETRSFDLFSDLDLNSLWEEKLQHRGGGDSGGLSAADTMIIPSSALEEAQNNIPSPREKVSRGASDRFIQKEPVKAEEERDETLEDDAALLANLESFLEAGEKAFAPPENAAAGDDDADYIPVADGDDSGGDELLSFDDFPDFDSIGGDVRPPSVSDDDIVQSPRKQPPPKPRPAASVEDFSDEVAHDERPTDYDTVPVDFVADAARDHADAVAEPVRRRLTTDELLDEIDFDNLDVNADVQAPVVGNDDIDMLRNRPRAGTEEMRAIVTAAEAAESGDDPDYMKNAGLEPGIMPSGMEDAVEDAGPPADEVAVNPMDVFANMDDMDFSDDFDDDMKAMLDDENEGEAGDDAFADVVGEGFGEETSEPTEEAKGIRRIAVKAKRVVRRAFFRVMPERYVMRILTMLAWRENWWFYCDLLAAIIASASLAVILSYYLWYRD